MEKLFVDVDAFVDKTLLTEKRFVVRMEDMLHDNAFVYKTVYTDLAKELINAVNYNAVEVVRCKDCRYKGLLKQDDYGSYICKISGMYPKSMNDYCSYGERRQDD